MKAAMEDDRKATIVLIVGLITFRIIDALTIRTFFQPDEYFQSLDPAWQAAFGDSSGAWITWEWREHLRSSIHPLLFAGTYRMAAQLSESIRAPPHLRAEILVAAPKVLQAVFAAATDFFTYRLASKLYGARHSASMATLALTLCSPWQWFASVRTFSNSMEATLTIIALDLWPWDWFLEQDRPSKRPHSLAERKAVPSGIHTSLITAATACVLRPTNIIVWATVSMTLLLRHGGFQKLLPLAQAATVTGSAVLAFSIGMDRAFCGTWVFPPLRFIYFNVYQSLAVFYGQNRPDYYLTEGLPLLLTTTLPFAVVGTWRAFRPGPAQKGREHPNERCVRFVLAMAVTSSIVTLSIISHKEVRFIYPLLPVLNVLAARPAAVFFAPIPNRGRWWRLTTIVLALATNVFIAIYTGYVHQRGVVDVMHYLRHEHETRALVASSPSTGLKVHPNMTVGFFMPCHSTPWRSHLVYPEINAWALTCEPPLGLTLDERKTYLDEADIFYADPSSWTSENMQNTKTVLPESGVDGEPGEHSNKGRVWPQYLVFFQQLEQLLRDVLAGTRYQECWRGFNTHWHDDRRRKGDVVVWCLR